MKIHILSDLHLEFQPFNIPDMNTDIVVLAGDIDLRERGIKWAIQNIPNKPVIYVLGNHEYYGSAYPRLVEKLKDYSLGTNVHVLENDLVTIEGINFLGCTLWTDFKLFGEPRMAGVEASQVMNDYKKIRLSPQYSKLRTIDTALICKKSVNWLKNTLSGLSGKTIIISHHAPSVKSIPFQYKEDILSAAYASNLDTLVEESGALLWIHGHIHNQLDYQIGLTRVICNPRGYPDEPNNCFNPGLSVEI
ncbi:phosphoesterase [Nostoc sp. 'Peltigera membranacea cyanobiont' 210A]|uniref:metallophosphoesterase n=1 Tax=Nostoc sp. 'Peltigera membranacea cyanobiont' 210A TaxID=2014529 RepID=UPI000B9543A0|nr:metallophosphoesterase [Nostoc sp. 'Peltigera membranacea cyanobiont' 210A]OYD93727.1 phosphoesterase [Nostoc sp. 'Peltigera membranacea cyanobiont' 210A]